MTSHSELGYYVRGLEARLVADYGADAAYCRHAFNNLNHLADEYGQAPAGLVMKSGSEIQQATVSTSNLIRFKEVGSLEWPLRVRADGSSFRVICRVRGRISTGTADVEFAIRLTHNRDGHPEPNVAEANVALETVSSTSLTYLDFDPIYLTAAQVSAAETRPFPTKHYDGSLGSVDLIVARLDLYARTSQSGSKPTISLWEYREFVG